MAFTILDAAGPVITVKVTGELSRSEVAQIQAASLDVIRRRGKVSALFILEDFKGWKRGDKWVMSHFCLLTTRTSPELPLLVTRRGGGEIFHVGGSRTPAPRCLRGNPPARILG